MKKIGYLKGEKPVNLSQVLVVTPPKKTPVDIKNWKDAENYAQYGRRYSLVEILTELANDPVASNAIEKRCLAVTNSEIVFKKGDKPVHEMDEFIDSREFENLLEEFLWTKFLGKTVVDLYWENGKFKPFSVPRTHLHTVKKVILKSIYDDEGIPYENDDFIINLGNDSNFGILNKVAPFLIYKRNGAGDFSQFVELQGIQTLIGKYDADDETGRQEMEEAFKKRGSGGSMTISKNSEVEQLDQNVASNTAAHEKLLNWCDEQIIIGILGQTMTTKDGASYSQAQVHSDTEDDINQADRRYIQRILNTELLPRLEKRGYPVKGGKFEFAEKGEKLGKEQQLKIAETIDKLSASGVDEDYFFENFGLPKGKGKAPEPTPEPVKPGTKKSTKKEDPIDPKAKSQKLKAKKLSWYKQLADFFLNALQ